MATGGAGRDSTVSLRPRAASMSASPARATMRIFDETVTGEVSAGAARGFTETTRGAVARAPRVFERWRVGLRARGADRCRAVADLDRRGGEAVLEGTGGIATDVVVLRAVDRVLDAVALVAVDRDSLHGRGNARS